MEKVISFGRRRHIHHTLVAQKRHISNMEHQFFKKRSNRILKDKKKARRSCLCHIFFLYIAIGDRCVIVSTNLTSIYIRNYVMFFLLQSEKKRKRINKFINTLWLNLRL